MKQSMNRPCFQVTVLFSALILLLTSLPGPAADYVLDEVDHARARSLWSSVFYEDYDHETFTDFHPFQQSIDFTDIDYPLLHAALFFESNRVRVKHGESSAPLEFAA